jgi:hypothetical protein
VLALPSAIAWLGWVGGMAALLAFAAITLYTSNLLAACYFVRGKRNRTVSRAGGLEQPRVVCLFACWARPTRTHALQACLAGCQHRLPCCARSVAHPMLVHNAIFATSAMPQRVQSAVL